MTVYMPRFKCLVLKQLIPSNKKQRELYFNGN